MTTGSVLKFENVDLVRDQTKILKNINFETSIGQHLVILGPNGAGKTSLIDIAAGFQFPTNGRVEILGREMGKTDLSQLKLSIGYAGPRLNLNMDPNEKVFDAVISAAYGIVGRWQEIYSALDLARAEQVLEIMGMGQFKDRTYGYLSAGEKKKVDIARALMNDPELLILDEPAASLDLPSREDLLYQLDELINSGLSPALIMVTHHIEEIPNGFNQALLLSEGEVFSHGDIETTLSEENLTNLYGLKIRVVKTEGRRFAYRSV
jgi:iron complex transport system ATP-binding protein